MLHPKLQVSLLGLSFPAYLFFGVLGYTFGCLFGFFLVWSKGLNPWVIFLLMGISALTFFALALLVKAIKGREDLVYYHQEIAILVTTGGCLWLIGQPVLPYLEITLLGIGLFLAFGRIGCFSVGCCHGKPCHCKFAALYSQDHAKAGFPYYYVGLPLLPIQLIEAVWVFFTVVIGAFFIVGDYPSGSALIWYTVAYGIPRFGFEYVRGDPERPYRLGFSEAQWTTVALLSLSVILGYFNILPFVRWHLYAGVLLFGFVVGVAIYNIFRADSNYHLTNPRHIKEFVQTVSALHRSLPQTNSKHIPIYKTSQGLSISHGQVSGPEMTHCYYTISTKNNARLKPQVINYLAKIIRQIRYPNHPFQIQKGKQEIIHILFSHPVPATHEVG